MSARQPWWHSDAGDLDRDQDPLVAHLAARRDGHDNTEHGVGRGTGDADADQAGADPADGHPSDGNPSDADRTGADHVGPDCDVCPICRGLALVRESHPAVAEHLAEAARHLTEAVRQVADTLAAQGGPGDPGGDGAAPGQQSPDQARRRRPGRAAPFETIELDDDGPDRPG